MYLISYDLHNPGQNYDTLIAAIKAYGSWAKISRSCWAVKTNQNAVQIRNNLSRFIDSDDVLFVCHFDNWAANNLPVDVSNWLNA